MKSYSFKYLDCLVILLLLNSLACSPSSSSPSGASGDNNSAGTPGSSATKMYIFQSENALSAGEILNRARATNMCRGSYYILNSAVTCTKFSAFMLFEEDVSAVGLSLKENYPTTVPIFLLNGSTQVAADYDDLLQSPPRMLLGQYGMKAQYFWNGMNAGNVVGNNCSNWTNSVSGTGKVGSLFLDSAFNSWVNVSISCSNSSQARIMCMCW